MNTSLMIRDLPSTERPRERLVLNGAENLKTAELLAILIRTGRKGHSALSIAEHLLSRFQTLGQLSAASLEELQAVAGVGPDKAVTLKSAFTLAHRLSVEIRTEMPLMDSPDHIADLLREEMRLQAVETFFVILLNTRRRLIRVEKISQGTLDTLLVHPREVFRSAVTQGASAIVLAHNHPSGDPAPSEADIKVTRDLIRAGQLMKIEVLDHVIVGRRTTERPRDYVSLRELGYFY